MCNRQEAEEKKTVTGKNDTMKMHHQTDVQCVKPYDQDESDGRVMRNPSVVAWGSLGLELLSDLGSV